MTWTKMHIVYDDKHGRMMFRPKHTHDSEKFQHCTGGSIAVTDIARYISTFGMHGLEIVVEEPNQ